MQAPAIRVPLSKLNATYARTWLMNNDPEAKEFWANVKDREGLLKAVEDNLYQFGINEQSGSIIITTSDSMYFDDEIRMRNL